MEEFGLYTHLRNDNQSNHNNNNRSGIYQGRYSDWGIDFADFFIVSRRTIFYQKMNFDEFNSAIFLFFAFALTISAAIKGIFSIVPKPEDEKIYGIEYEENANNDN